MGKAIITLFLLLTLPYSILASDRNLSNCEIKPQSGKTIQSNYAQIDTTLYFSEEQANIKKASKIVSRKGEELELKAQTRTVVLKNNLTEGESAVKYAFISHMKDIGYFLVLVGGWEGHEFLLVSVRAGNEISLEGRPIVSPDKKRLAASSIDLEAGYLSNSIQIWNIETSSPKIEFETDFGEKCGPSDLKWINNQSLKFIRNTLESPEKLKCLGSEFQINWIKGKWEIK
ncbi:hypothetical protein [Desulforegula conservatrix]|uniref:hypothetical protein n=1 Tax=Desulforegula conservatrix TaxID=153026 RepID=UPI0003F8F9EC|nr:hypothetical protein [Desulforegula conservatrix]